ncbi:MAG: efflux RND transporter periplasmic adaptor subunit, partial [Chlamydiales bacterium]
KKYFNVNSGLCNVIQKYLLPLLAIVGALFGLAIVYWSQKTMPVPPIAFPPATSPYPHSIAGAGIIEASSQNISIGTPFNEVIWTIFVIEGDHVKKGDLLIQLDLRNFEAQLETAQANLNLAQVNLEDKSIQYSFYQRLRDKKAVSEQIYQEYHYAMLEAEKNVRIAEAEVNEVQTNIQRSIIRAPVDGEILQVNCHIGEIAPVVPFISAQSTWLTAANGTLILMGTVSPLQVRIDIDEDDAWRYENGSPATAFVRGNRNINFPLTYFRTEPYIIPKTSFTGETVERVDTRVLQVLYQFERMDLPIYPGQILDIFIESKPIENLAK